MICSTVGCPREGKRWAIQALQIPYGTVSASGWPTTIGPTTFSVPTFTSGSYTIHIPYWVCDECAKTLASVGAALQPPLEELL